VPNMCQNYFRRLLSHLLSPVFDCYISFLTFITLFYWVFNAHGYKSLSILFTLRIIFSLLLSLPNVISGKIFSVHIAESAMNFRVSSNSHSFTQNIILDSHGVS
jgi:hypothetical protein